MCSVHRSRLPQGRDRKPLLFAKCSNGLLFPIVKKRKQSHVDKPDSKLGKKRRQQKLVSNTSNEACSCKNLMISFLETSSLCNC